MNATAVVMAEEFLQLSLQIERMPEKCTIKILWVAMHRRRQVVGPSVAPSSGSDPPGFGQSPAAVLIRSEDWLVFRG